MLARDMQTLVYNFIEGLGPAHFERPESRTRRIRRRVKLILAKKMKFSYHQSKILSRHQSKHEK